MSVATPSAAVPSAAACANYWNPPESDVLCALPGGSESEEIMSACCGDASIISFYDGCGLYCLALDQSAEDLSGCFADEGAVHGEFYCSGNKTESATATGPGDVPASASASLVSGGDDDDDDDSSSGSGSGSSGSDGDDDGDDDDDDSAAGIVKPQVTGLAIGALLFSATALGAFAL